MKQSDRYFLEQIREFKKIEQEYIRFNCEAKTPRNKEESEQFFMKSIELAFDAVEKRNLILGEMYDITDIQINDPEVKRIIEKLKKGERFESLNFAENLASLLNEDIDDYSKRIKTDLRDYFADKFDEFWDDFHQTFYIADFYYRRAQVGAIITSSKLPSNIIQYFNEIKEAYAFELDKSCISLSRALLEIAIFDKLKKKGYFRSSKIISIDEAKKSLLKGYIMDAYREGLLSKNVKNLAVEINNRGNRVLHIKDTTEYSVRGLALKTIKDTVEVIEYLYR